MTDSPIIERIEFTAFEIKVENMSADPAGFGISYTPGKAGTHLRFGLRIYTDPVSLASMCPGGAA
jgi:hypothetical protein